MAANIRNRLLTHGPPLLLFVELAVAWTWPLVVHLGDAIPGDPGDNFGCVWNLWWMRHVLATPGLPYFRTTYLFYPFGTTIVDHPHMALPALVGATLLKTLSVVAAQNVLILMYVFLNMACAYALAWAITKHTRGSVLAAVVFGLSPYVAVHLLGHFELVPAFTLPLFALALRFAVRDSHSAIGSPRFAAFVAGVVFAATAYISYYYVVYISVFMLVYLVAWAHPFGVSRAVSPPSLVMRRLRIAVVAAGGVCLGTALVIAATGGGSWSIGAVNVSMRAPQNTLAAMWLCGACAAVAFWRPRIALDASAREAQRDALRVAAIVGMTFVVGAAPLLWEAAGIIARGEYVTPEYNWRSVPTGVDLLAPFAGHPLHPLFGAVSRRAYAAFGRNFVEVIGWFGVVPLVLLAATRPWRETARVRSVTGGDRRMWRVVAVTFGVWALGPILLVAGFDTGLRLPAILLRYVPLVANARMPGRAVVVVYLALAVILAIRSSEAAGRFRSPLLQWLAIAIIAFEYWAAPVRMTRLDWPPVYRALASADAGAVCEVPLGIGDGLSGGVGSQDRRVLFYATEHEHPLVGGYIGRMPADAAERYRRIPIAGTLLALSDGASLPAQPDLDVSASPCRYLVVHRGATTTSLVSYLQLLKPKLIAEDSEHSLYQIR
jgi:hypothetical protein